MFRSPYRWAGVALGLGFYLAGGCDWLFRLLELYLPPVAYFILGGSHAYRWVLSSLWGDGLFSPFLGISFWYDTGLAVGMFLPFVAVTFGPYSYILERTRR